MGEMPFAGGDDGDVVAVGKVDGVLILLAAAGVDDGGDAGVDEEFGAVGEREEGVGAGGTSLQRWHRDLLRSAMEAEGFTVYEAEWWHFDFKDWRKYPILNQRFEEIKQ